MGFTVRRFLGYIFPHLQGSLALLPGFYCRCETVVIRPRRTMAVFPARSGSTDGTSFRAFVNILPCPVCVFLPLFTQVRGTGILGSSDTGSCIKPRNTPPRWPWADPIHTQGGRYYLRLDAYAGIWMLPADASPPAPHPPSHFPRPVWRRNEI
jgi:hypothetical protein